MKRSLLMMITNSELMLFLLYFVFGIMIAGRNPVQLVWTACTVIGCASLSQLSLWTFGKLGNSLHHSLHVLAIACTFLQLGVALLAVGIVWIEFNRVMAYVHKKVAAVPNHRDS